MKLILKWLFLILPVFVNAQSVEIKYIVDDDFQFNHEYVTGLSHIPDNEFLSFSLRAEELETVEKVEIFLYKYSSNGEFTKTRLKAESHSYQEETKNAGSTFISELIYLESGTDSISVSVSSASGFRLGKSKIIARIYNPFFGIKYKSEPKSDTLGCEKPPIRKRSEWNCPDGDSCLHGTLIYTNVTHLIVHHSAGANTAADWDAVLRSIWDYHVNTNGWIDIGYNYLIDPNGVVYEGRAGGDNVVGAHFSAMNSHTMGVCVLGTYTTVLPTTIALKSTARILGWKAQLENIYPFDSAQHQAGFIPQIAGHRDSGSGTECPGNAFYPYLPQLRQQVLDCIHGVLSMEQIGESIFTIFPVPASQNINIQTTENNYNLFIYNALGTNVLSGWFSGNQCLDLSSFPSGMYFFKIQTNKEVKSLKVVVE